MNNTIELECPFCHYRTLVYSDSTYSRAHRCSKCGSLFYSMYNMVKRGNTVCPNCKTDDLYSYGDKKNNRAIYYCKGCGYSFTISLDDGKTYGSPMSERALLDTIKDKYTVKEIPELLVKIFKLYPDEFIDLGDVLSSPNVKQTHKVKVHKVFANKKGAKSNGGKALH